jgi:hypothetical protein
MCVSITSVTDNTRAIDYLEEQFLEWYEGYIMTAQARRCDMSAYAFEL